MSINTLDRPPLNINTLDRPSFELSPGTRSMGSEATLKLIRQLITMVGEPNRDIQTAPYGISMRGPAVAYDFEGHSSSMKVAEPGFALAEKHALVQQWDNEALRRLASKFEQRPGADDEE